MYTRTRESEFVADIAGFVYAVPTVPRGAPITVLQTGWMVVEPVAVMARNGSLKPPESTYLQPCPSKVRQA